MRLMRRVKNAAAKLLGYHFPPANLCLGVSSDGSEGTGGRTSREVGNLVNPQRPRTVNRRLGGISFPT